MAALGGTCHGRAKKLAGLTRAEYTALSVVDGKTSYGETLDIFAGPGGGLTEQDGLQAFYVLVKGGYITLKTTGSV